MERIKECPYCQYNFTLLNKEKEVIYRNQAIKVVEYYYKCQNCNAEFSSPEVNTINDIQVQLRYSEKK